MPRARLNRAAFIEDLEWILPSRPSRPEIEDALFMTMPAIYRRIARYAASAPTEKERLHLWDLHRQIVVLDETRRRPLAEAS